MRSHRRWLALSAWCLLLSLAWGLWLWRLDASDLTFDEAATYYVAHRPPLEIFSYLRGAVREHPPVYYLVMRGWMALAGTSEFSLRLFSVGAGLAGLALTGWLARLALGRFGRTGALLAAAWLVVTPGMAYYAREARMYSLGVAWTVLSAGLLLRDWLPSKTWPRAAALASLAIVHLLALFTHYYLLFPILVQALVLLLLRRWRPFVAWCGLHGLLALTGLLWFRLAPGLQMTAGSRLLLRLTLPSPTRFELLHLLGKLLFSPVVRVRFRLLDALLLLTCVGLLVALWRRRRVGVWLTLSLLVPLALVHTVPQPPAPRYVVFLTPFMTLALSFLCVEPCHLSGLKWGGLKRAWRVRWGGRSNDGVLAEAGRSGDDAPASARWRWLSMGVIFTLALVIAWLLVAGGLHQALAFDRSHYGRTLETIQAYARPGDAILFYGPWQWIQFEYYDPGGLPPITALPPAAPPRLKPEEAEPVLRSLLTTHDRLWVLPAAVDDVDPAHFVAGWLHTHAHKVWGEEGFGLYLPSLPPSAPVQRVGLTFGDALSLERVAYEAQVVPAGEALRLTLYWKPLRRLEGDIRLTLSLVDQDGHVWDEARSMPGHWAAPPSTWELGQGVADYEGLRVPQGAPVGEYAVRLLVAEEMGGEPLLVDGRKEAEVLTVQVVEPVHPPVLYGLPNPDAAVFCPPDGEPCLTLAGFEPGGLRFQQGHSVPFRFHWLVPQGKVPPVVARWRVVHRPWLPLLEAMPIVTRTFSLTSSAPAETSPSSSVSLNGGEYRVVLPLVSDGATERSFPRLVTVQTALMLPPDAPTGRASVDLALLGPDGRLWATTRDGLPILRLFDITIEGRPIMRRLPAGVTPTQVDFGEEIGLRGYHVEGDARPGGEVRVTYVWFARTRPTAIYAVFNHLVAADGTMAAQADGWPQEGRMLTIQWQKGEYVEDTHTLVIPVDAPPGPYTLYAGLYDAATGDRQSAFREGRRLPDDRVLIPLPGEDG